MTVAGRTLVGVALLVAWVAWAPGAQAAAPRVRVAPLAGPPGATVSVSGAGFCPAPCASVELSFGGATVRDNIQVDAAGRFHTTFTVPATALGGVNSVFAEQRDTSGSDRAASAAFRVTPSTPVLGSSLRRTSPPRTHTSAPTSAVPSSSPRKVDTTTTSPPTTAGPTTPPPTELASPSASQVAARADAGGFSAWWWILVASAVALAGTIASVAWRRRASHA